VPSDRIEYEVFTYLGIVMVITLPIASGSSGLKAIRLNEPPTKKFGVGSMFLLQLRPGRQIS
jgi:hypothetical protein